MKRITIALLFLGAFSVKAQDTQNDTIKVNSIETLKESIDDHSMRFSGLDERLATIESDLGKLTKIKVSGYMQVQYDMYDIWAEATSTTTGGVTTTTPAYHGSEVIKATSTVPGTFVTNSFYLRRARLKFTYEALDGVKFVLQPDLAFDKVSLKDAYVVLNDRWTKTFSLTMGQFNRLSYDVEYSSGSREVLERAKVTQTIYPNERDLGAKLEANFDTKYNIPFKLQLAFFNGNFGQGATTAQVKDVDNAKDFMARGVYNIKLPNAGLGIDLGAHLYSGKTEILNGTTLGTTVAPVFYDAKNVAFVPVVGDKLDKKWTGFETQIYYDFLGGMALKAEYISGTLSGVKNPTDVTLPNNNASFNFSGVRKFSGYYATLVKNIGVKNQLTARYDVFDPNTNLSGDDVKLTTDLKFSTWSFSFQHFFDDNLKIVLGYTAPTNEKSVNAGSIAKPDYFNRDKKDNTFTIRLQARF
jgi:Phosphate-selective porin O and P